MKERITLNMSMMDALKAMCGTNPGALTACLALIKHAPTIDPDSLFGEWSPLIALDVQGIYEDRIWILWKDVCGQDPVKVLALLRAVQLGHLAGISKSKIHAAINGGCKIDLEEVLSAVQKNLPKFAASPDTGG